MPLTESDIESLIAKEDYYTVGAKTTICVLTLDNGFEVIGKAGCLNPDDYDLGKGKPIARRRAVDKLWELEGYKQQ